MVNSCINFRTKVVSISFGNLKAKLIISNASHQPSDEKECFFLDTIEGFVEDQPPIALHDEIFEDPLRGEELMTGPFGRDT
jgi:hypothetical protein